MLRGYQCTTCCDTGIVELDGVAPAEFAWQIPFTTMPCLCERGNQIASTHEFCRNDSEWKAKWESSHGEQQQTS